MSKVVQLKTRKPSEADDAAEHAEYLELNRKEALSALEALKRMVEAGEVCGVMILAATPPARDSAGYRLMFNDAIEDYHMLTLGMIESAKMRLQAMQDNWEDGTVLPVPDS